MRVSRALILGALLFAPGVLIASEHFDGNWHTRITCPPRKGTTENSTWSLNTVVENGIMRGVFGSAGQPGSLVLEGQIADDGSALLTGSVILQTKQDRHKFFAHTEDTFSWELKAHFRSADGTAMRNEGIGIADGPCKFEFVKELVMVNPG